jgi:translocation and assembly module TamB
MRRALKVLGWAVAALVVVPVVLVALLLGAMNTGPGKKQVTALLNHVLAGQLQVEGLSGRVPDRLRIARVSLEDKKGAWATADGVTLDWSPLALLHKIAEVSLLHADRLRVERLKESEGGSSSTNLPVRVRVAHIAVDRAELAAAVPGGPAALALDGSLGLDTYTQGAVTLDAKRLDGAGAYRVQGSLYDTPAPGRVTLALDLDEPAGGIVSRAANLPGLGALSVHARLAGPRTAAALDASVAAGKLRAAAKGTLDLIGSSADLTVQASAPAMAPRPDLRWQAVALDAHVQGSFTKPQGQGTLRVDALEASGGAVAQLRAAMRGDTAGVHLTATADGVRVPGPDPALLAASPVQLSADAKLDDPARPAVFQVKHALFSIQGQAATAGTLAGKADVLLPDLAPLARLGGADVAGRAALHLKGRVAGGTHLDADGTISLTAAPGPTVALLGPEARVGLSAEVAGDTMTLTQLQVNGAKLALGAHGSLADGSLDGAAHVALSDLAAAVPTLAGRATLDATAKGKLDDLAATLDAQGSVGTRGFAPAPLRVQAQAEHLPGAPTGSIKGQGTLDGAPLTLDASARRAADGSLAATIQRAAWRSFAADGAFTLAPGATVPQGRVSLRVGQLADFRALTGESLAGSVEAQASLDAAAGRLQAKLSGVAVPGAQVGVATVQASIADPLGHPRVQAHIVADGAAAGGASGNARIEANGPEEALALRVDAEVQVKGTPAQVQGAAVLDVPGKRVALSALTATARGQALRLVAPARVSFGDGVAVDRLRLALAGATAEIAGKLSPVLDATFQARVPGSLAGLYDPAYAADGSLGLDATVRGTPARPTGTARLDISGLHLRQGPGQAVPPLNAQATAQLSGESARIQGQARAGTAHLTLDGTAPLASGRPLDLRAAGALDLALLDPLVSPAGRRVKGRVTLDARATGTLGAPRLAGQVSLAGGEVQDFAQGLRLTDLTGTALLQGDDVVIPGFTGHAGPGTVALSGRVGALRPGLPVDLQVRMQDARALASDLLTARLNGSVAVRGSVAQGLAASGTVDVLRADIRVPEQLPSSVQTLDVVRPGQKPTPPAASAVAVRLDLTVRAAQAIFVRGRGLDAEMTGRLRLGGTTAAPQVGGGFDLRRGTFSLAGTTLTFTKGKVSFEGTGLSDKLDPSLDFEATSTTAQVTATLTIGGTAKAPKITLASVPPLPQDEVLSYLLFRRSVKDIGPFQYAEIAAALAEVSGVGGGLSDPLNGIRKGLGLDRLTVGSTATNTAAAPNGSNVNAAPTVEAGRYVANGVYVGATQDVTGQGTGAQVQIDLTKRLKLDTTVGSGQIGNQVGLSYQFEW